MIPPVDTDSLKTPEQSVAILRADCQRTNFFVTVGCQITALSRICGCMTNGVD